MIQSTDPAIYSVSSLTRELKYLVEGKYRFIRVQGEISNLKRPYSGHAYFTLKDSGAQLKGVLFKGQSRYLDHALEDGQQVICHGRISIYEPRGDYQIIVDNVDFQGSGLLQIRFEEMKKKLASEGLFDQVAKQQLNSYPRKIVLITSPSGAAVHDFLHIWRKKNFPTDITILPVRVQGETAASEISNAITSAHRHLPETDIIVLCRGGGSLEDLWPFNEEVVARAIARASIPIVSAIGHDVDFSISDFCADLRAPTPTAAAEMIIPDGNELKLRIQNIRNILLKKIDHRLEDLQYRVDQNHRLLGDMDFLFINNSLRLDHASHRLYAVMEKQITTATVGCNELSSRLRNSSPIQRLTEQAQKLGFATEKLGFFFHKSLADKEANLAAKAALLDSVSPLATMARGYSIVSKIDKKSGRKSIIQESAKL